MPFSRRCPIALAAALVLGGCLRIGHVQLTVAPPGVAGVHASPSQPATAPPLLATGEVGVNTGTLIGTVLGPPPEVLARHVADPPPGAGVVSDHGSGLIANNSGSLIGKTKSRRLLDDEVALVPVSGASVEVLGPDGQPLTAAPVTTDATGGFSITGLPPSTPLVFLRARYRAGGAEVALYALGAAPRADRRQAANLTPASTLVAKKILTGVRQGVVALAKVQPETVGDLTRLVAPVMSERAIALAAILPEDQVARAFDAMLTDSPDLRAAAGQTAGDAGVPELVAVTADRPVPSPLPTSPAPLPVASPVASPALPPSPTPSTGPAPSPSAGASVAPSTAPSAAPTPTTAPSSAPTPVPTATPTPVPTPAQVQAITLGTVAYTAGIGLGVSYDAGSNTVTVSNRRSYVQVATLAALDQPASFTQDASVPRALQTTFDAGTRYWLSLDNALVGWSGGQAANTALNNAQDFVVKNGFAYVTGFGAPCIFRVDLSSGATDVLAGTTTGSQTGTADGTGAAARFNYPAGIALGSDGALYVADSLNHRIRRVTLAGDVTTIAGGTYGYADGSGTSASFEKPVDVAADDAGNLYVVDLYDNHVRRVTLAGNVTTVAGNGTQASTDGLGSQIAFSQPMTIAWGRFGGQPVLVVGETDNGKIRLVSHWQ